MRALASIASLGQRDPRWASSFRRRRLSTCWARSSGPSEQVISPFQNYGDAQSHRDRICRYRTSVVDRDSAMEITQPCRSSVSRADRLVGLKDDGSGCLRAWGALVLDGGEARSESAGREPSEAGFVGASEARVRHPSGASSIEPTRLAGPGFGLPTQCSEAQ